MKIFVIIALVFAQFLFPLREDIFFQSEELSQLNLHLVYNTMHISNDDGDQVEIKGLKDEDGLLYWYQNINTPVCLTGECKEINVGIYWYCTGEFLGLEVYGEDLTKTDHSIFSNKDYQLLITTLKNDWSVLREYDFEDLLNEETGVDGVTGATRKEIADESVKDAVYTTYTLWHVVHKGEKDQLRTLTANNINKERSLLEALLSSPKKQYQQFLLELYKDGKIDHFNALNQMIISGLKENSDDSFRELSYKALNHVNFMDSTFQQMLAKVYMELPDRNKVRILNAMGPVNVMEEDLYYAFTNDINVEKEWLMAKTLIVLKTLSNQSQKILEMASKLTESNNAYLKGIAVEFLEANRKKEKKF